jgi:hypothetical protein
VISHRFHGSGEELLVVDEWPEQASFETFFAETPEIAHILTGSEARGEPVVTFWTLLDTGDEV